MLRHSMLFTVVTLELGFVNTGMAVVIEGTELPPCTEITDQLAATHFVRFSSNAGHVTFERNGGRFGIYGTDSDGFRGCARAKFHAPISVFFVDPLDPSRAGVVNGTITTVWGDGGGDQDSLTLEAYDLNGRLIHTANSRGSTWQTLELSSEGIHEIRYFASAGAPESSDTFIERLTYPIPASTGVERPLFLRGDANDDGHVNISDPLHILNWLFAGASPPGCIAATNVNGDDTVDIVDPTYLLNHLFSSGSTPVAPFPDCGASDLPADQELGCVTAPEHCQR